MEFFVYVPLSCSGIYIHIVAIFIEIVNDMYGHQYNFDWDVGVPSKSKFYHRRNGQRSKKLCGKLRHVMSYVTQIVFRFQSL